MAASPSPRVPAGVAGPVVPRAVDSPLDRLRAALRALAADLERGSRRRCPHRGARDRCRYGHACRNRRGDRCTADAVERGGPR